VRREGEGQVLLDPPVGGAAGEASRAGTEPRAGGEEDGVRAALDIAHRGAGVGADVHADSLGAALHEHDHAVVAEMVLDREPALASPDPGEEDLAAMRAGDAARGRGHARG